MARRSSSRTAIGSSLRFVLPGQPEVLSPPTPCSPTPCGRAGLRPLSFRAPNLPGGGRPAAALSELLGELDCNRSDRRPGPLRQFGDRGSPSRIEGAALVLQTVSYEFVNEFRNCGMTKTGFSFKRPFDVLGGHK